MTHPAIEPRWIDAEAAGRSLGVCGMTVRRWCLAGLVPAWRTLGLGQIKRYQVSEEALEELRARFITSFHGEQSDETNKANNPNNVP